MNYSTERGLVPGILNNLENMNPFGLFGAFMSGTNPDCMAITLPTKNAKNIIGTDTKYLTVNDIKNMSPCWFPNNVNPITKTRGKHCVEGFENQLAEFKIENPFDELNILDDLFDINDFDLFKISDIVAYLYFISLILLFLSLIKVKG